MEKHAVRIRREWANASIFIDVTDDEIQISMPLSAFLDALAQEATHPLFWLTKTGMADEIRNAAEEVVRKMKQETVTVM